MFKYTRRVALTTLWRVASGTLWTAFVKAIVPAW
jgi:hypothetical protein